MTTRLLPFALSALLLGAGLLVTPPASAVDPEADLTPPVITVPGDLTVEATGPTGATVSYTDATAVDDVDGPVPVTCVDQADQTHTSGDTFPLGTTTLTCTATDSADNTAQATFTITVEDTTAPTVTVPNNITAEATGPTGRVVSYTAATATDLVDGTLPTTCVDQADQTHTSGDTFPLGTTTLTCTATDSVDNTGQATFTITVEDTTAPTVTVPSDITGEATGPSGRVVSYTAATATDLVDGTLPVTCTSHPTAALASGSTFPLGTTTLTCTATDSADNTGQATFTITVEDTTAPTMTVPSDITGEATGPNGRRVFYTAPTATDLVSGSRSVTCTSLPTTGLSSGSFFPLGITTFDCVAVDAAGNEKHRGFTVTVRDTTKPLISGTPNNLEVEALGASGAPASFTPPTSSDLVDGSLPVTCNRASGSTFVLGSTIVTCTVTDAAHNTATSQFTVTVVDRTPPELNTPDSLTVPADSPLGAVVELDIYAMDLVDGRIDATCTPLLAIYPIGTTTIWCEVSDQAENQAISVFDLNVEGVTNPQLNATVSSPQPKLHGWYRAPVTVSFTCTPGSSPDLDPCPEPVLLTTSGRDLVVDRTIHAADGGHARVVVSVDLDTVKPTVRITKLTSKQPRCVATDALSGVDTCRLTHRKAGKKIVWKATGVDLAGNRQVVQATTRA